MQPWGWGIETKRSRGNVKLEMNPGLIEAKPMWETKTSGNVDKINCPYNLQLTDKYLRWQGRMVLQEAPILMLMPCWREKPPSLDNSQASSIL